MALLGASATNPYNNKVPVPTTLAKNQTAPQGAGLPSQLGSTIGAIGGAFNSLMGGIQTQGAKDFPSTNKGVATLQTAQPVSTMNRNNQITGNAAVGNANTPSASTGTGMSYKGVPITGDPSTYQAQIQAINAQQTVPVSGTPANSTDGGTTGSNQTIQPTPGTTTNGTYNPYTANQGMYGQLITGLANTPTTDTNVATATKNLQDLQNQYAGTVANIKGSPFGLTEQTGQEGILQQQYSTQLGTAQTALQNALQAQSLQQSALGTAAGLAAPTTQYGTLTNPITGQAISGGTAGSVLPSSAQTLITQMAQQVQSGQMTYQQALSNLSAYGPAGISALTSALGPSFNVNASTASAGTTAQGQQIQTQSATANSALDTLGSSFSSLSGLQTGGIPATNSIAQWIGSELGDSALSKYKSNLADARAQLVGVLNTAGGTPTGNEQTALQYLPDNMTPAMFQQNVGTAQNPGMVRQLMQQKVQKFTTSGQQNGTTGTTIDYNF